MEAIFNAAKSLSPIVAQKLLSKKDPRWKKVFSKAAAYGFTGPQVIDYFSSKFDTSTQSQPGLRPDEMLGQSQVKRSNLPNEVVKTLLPAGIGAGLELGSQSPMEQLSTDIPQMEQQSAPAPEGTASPRNLEAWNSISDKFPQIVQQIQSLSGQGHTPEMIAEILRNKRLYAPIIEYAERNANMPFEEILYQFMGNQPKQAQSPQRRNPTLANLLGNVERNMPRF